MPAPKPKLNADELRQAVRADFSTFVQVMNPRFVPAKFQREIIMPVVTRFEKGEWDRLAILIPPNHGKTSAISVPLPQFRLGNQPHKNVILLAYSNELAMDFGQRVKNGVQAMTYRSVFPSFKLQKGAQSKKFFRTTEGGTFYAIGTEGSVEGKRADLLIIDDPIPNPQFARSETQMQTLMLTYETVVKTRLNPGGQILLITTRWCLNDFVDRVMEREGEQWKVLTLPAEPDPENEPGKYLWPEYFNNEHYERFKLNTEIWNSKFMQAPQRGQGPWFKSRQWIVWYEKEVKRGKYNTYMLVDPALKKLSTSDNTSIMVVMCAPPVPPSKDPAFILVDWVLDRMDPGERHLEMIRLIRKWGIIKIGFEEYGLMSDSYHLENALREASCYIPIMPLGRSGPSHNIKKEDRIGNLIPMFRQGQIVMPRTMPRRLRSGEVIDLMRYFLEEEYDIYAGKNTTRHDDALDSLSRIQSPEMYYDHSIPGKKEGNTWDSNGISWVCNY